MQSYIINTSKPLKPLDTAVLFIVFNRPDTTAQVFEAIRAAKPPRLYVAADGPRDGRVGEAGQVAEVREIATRVDWPCEIKTLFQKRNLGCKYAVSGAINWFFHNEDAGIILEDDVLPEQGFFDFCQAALQEYYDDARVGMVTGHSVRSKAGHPDKNYSTKFSSYGLVWGWATWRRTWQKYDVELSDWNPRELGFLRQKKGSSPLYVDMWNNLFSRVQAGNIDSWDYQLNYLLLRHNLLCVVPPYNLIDNIGYGGEATHTSGPRPTWLVRSCDIDMEYVRLSKPELDVTLDREIGAKIFYITYVAEVKNLVKKFIKGRTH